MATLCEFDDFDILKERTGISDKQLDRRIAEDKLWQLSGHLGSYELYIGVPGFNFNNATIADLKDCADKNGNQHAMCEALKKWHDETYTFTYRSLVKILINLGKRTLAETVCKTAIICKSISHKRGPGEMEPSAIETVPHEIERSSGQVRSGGGVDVEINNFKKRFQELKEATLKELTAENCKVSVSNFRQAFLLLPDSIANENENLVLSKYSIFEKAESIESILAHVSYYLSYIDYSLLEYIINKFCSERLKEDMRDYTQDMKEFKARTTISNALRYLPKPKLSNRTNLPANFSELTVEFDVDINVATLAKLDELRQIHADEFKLSHLAFFLFKFKKRSLLVTWLVPTSLEATISDKIQKTNIDFFSSNNILELSVGGKQLYPFKKEIDKTETSSDKFPEVTAKPGELLASRHLLGDTDTLGLSKPSLTQFHPSAPLSKKMIAESKMLSQYTQHPSISPILFQDEYTPYTRSRSDNVSLAAPYFPSKDIGYSGVHTIGESITGSLHSEYQETKKGSKPTVTAKPHHSSEQRHRPDLIYRKNPTAVIPRGSKDFGKRAQYFMELGFTRELVENILTSLADAPDDFILNRLVQCTPSQRPPRGDEPPPARLVSPELLRPVVIDGSNVAMKYGNGVFSCKGIQLAVDYFKQRGHSKITVFVPEWRKESPTIDHPIIDQHILRSLEQDGHLKYTPSRKLAEGQRIVCYNDLFIIKLATEEQGVIVSNDQYQNLVKEKAEWKEVIETRLLQFAFVDDYFMPSDDPLGRNGPTLDQLLSMDTLTPSQSHRGRRMPAASGQQPSCPFAERCTFRNCKYWHPERETFLQRESVSTSSHTHLKWEC